MTTHERYLVSLHALRQAAADFAHSFAQATECARHLAHETDVTKEVGARAHADVLATMRQLRDHIPGARDIFAQLNEVI